MLAGSIQLRGSSHSPTSIYGAARMRHALMCATMGSSAVGWPGIGERIVINDYHKMLIESTGVRYMPDDMVHALGAEIELKILEAGIKPNELAMFYESVYRQRPKIIGVTLEDAITTTERVG